VRRRHSGGTAPALRHRKWSTAPRRWVVRNPDGVFGEQERQIIRSRVLAGRNRVGKAKSSAAKAPDKFEKTIREHLSAGNGILKVASGAELCRP
jgi:hypothetical protein